MKFNKLKMAVMGALMVPMMPVVAEEAASEWGASHDPVVHVIR